MDHRDVRISGDFRYNRLANRLRTWQQPAQVNGTESTASQKKASNMGGLSERKKEIRRRRKRREQVTRFERRAAKASQSEKEMIASKLRRMTPGAVTLIERLELERR
jgi:hypothetical protein